MTRDHRRAWQIIGLATLLDVAGAFAFAAAEHRTLAGSLYWSITTATTVGYGDVVPRTTAGHVVACVVMLTIIPLFAATFSLLTSGLTAGHVTKETAEVHRKLDHIISESPEIGALPARDEGSAALRGIVAFAACALLMLVAIFWWRIEHELFVLSGIRAEAQGWYGFWSGFAGGIGIFGVFTLSLSAARHHNCHVKRCWRLGKPVEGTPFLACHRHHPDHPGDRRSVDISVIHAAHHRAARSLPVMGSGGRTGGSMVGGSNSGATATGGRGSSPQTSPPMAG